MDCGLSWWLSGKESAYNAGKLASIPASRSPWRREWPPTPVILSAEFHGQRSLASYSPEGHKESDMTDWLALSLYFLWPERRSVWLKIVSERENGKK